MIRTKIVAIGAVILAVFSVNATANVGVNNAGSSWAAGNMTVAVTGLNPTVTYVVTVRNAANTVTKGGMPFRAPLAGGNDNAVVTPFVGQNFAAGDIVIVVQFGNPGGAMGDIPACASLVAGGAFAAAACPAVPAGRCCAINAGNTCTNAVTQAACLGDEGTYGRGGGVYGGDDTTCAGNPCAAIPTVSQWGLIVMTLLLLTAATIIFARRRPAVSHA